MKNVKRIDSVFVQVTDMKRSEEWYTNIFNFKVTYRGSDGMCIGFRFDESGPLKTGLSIVKVDKVDRPQHIPFNFYVVDIDQFHNELKEKSVEVTKIHGEDGMRFFDFKDPDGNMIDVVTFPE